MSSTDNENFKLFETENDAADSRLFLYTEREEDKVIRVRNEVCSVLVESFILSSYAVLPD